MASSTPAHDVHGLSPEVQAGITSAALATAAAFQHANQYLHMAPFVAQPALHPHLYPAGVQSDGMNPFVQSPQGPSEFNAQHAWLSGVLAPLAQPQHPSGPYDVPLRTGGMVPASAPEELRSQVPHSLQPSSPVQCTTLSSDMPGARPRHAALAETADAATHATGCASEATHMGTEPSTSMVESGSAVAATAAEAEIRRLTARLAETEARASHAAQLAERMAEAEAKLAELRVELAVAEERAESYKALADAKDEMLASARKQTSEWRKLASEVLVKVGAGPGKEGSSSKESSSSSKDKEKSKSKK